MKRYLIVYLFALAGLSVAARLPVLTVLTPLSMTLLLAGAIIFWLLQEHPFRALGFPRTVSWLKQLAASTVAGIAIALLFAAILIGSGLVTINPGISSGIDPLPLLIFTVVWTALIAVSEELIFRGVYFQKFRERYSIMVAALLSAALWSIFHLPSMAADGLPTADMLFGFLTFVAFGVALALSAQLGGGSLWVPIGIHYGYNFGFSLLGAMLSFENSGPPLLTGSPGWVPETGLIGLIVWSILALGIFGLCRRRPRGVPNA